MFWGIKHSELKTSLKHLNVQFVYNSNYAKGLSSSLKAGVETLPDDCDGAVVALGDMPGVKAADIDGLIEEFDPARCQSIVVPTHNGKRGNPVVWARRYFKEISAVSGDVGARHLIGSNSDQLHEVPTENSGVLIDLDTPEAVEAHKTENNFPLYIVALRIFRFLPKRFTNTHKVLNLPRTHFQNTAEGATACLLVFLMYKK